MPIIRNRVFKACRLLTLGHREGLCSNCYLDGFFNHSSSMEEGLRELNTLSSRYPFVYISNYSYWISIVVKFLKFLLTKDRTPENSFGRDWLIDYLRLRGFVVVKAVPIRFSHILLSASSNFSLIHHLIFLFLWSPKVCEIFIVRKAYAHQVEEEQSITVIIPTKNEEDNVRRIVDDLLPFDSEISSVLVVDGKSTDRTLELFVTAVAGTPLANKLTLVSQLSGTKFQATLIGLIACDERSDVCIYDADATVSFAEIVNAVEFMREGRFDLINGDRLSLRYSEGAFRSLNYMGNLIFSFLLSRAHHRAYRDVLCGTKIINRSLIPSLRRRLLIYEGVDPFGDFGILSSADDLLADIAAYPFVYKARIGNETKISPLKDGALLIQFFDWYFKHPRRRSI